MGNKITAAKLGKRYLKQAERPILDASIGRSLEDIIPRIHTNVNTPTAKQLMYPEVGLGEGNIRDKSQYITVDDLPDDWLEKMQAAAMQGKGPVGFMVALNLTKAGFETLRATSPEFEEAFQRCLLLSHSWWEDRGCDMATGAKGNSTVWYAFMVNYWGWNSNKSVQTIDSTVKSEVQAKVSHELDEEQLNAELKKRGLDQFIDVDDRYD